MRIVLALVFGVATSVMASAAFAQRSPLPADKVAPVPVASQSLSARVVPVEPAQTGAEPRTLFHIGNVPVRVWAPVPAPYNSHMNRSAADNPMWESSANAF